MFFKRFIIVCLFLSASAIATVNFAEPITKLLAQLPFAADISLALLGVLAIHFGYSRALFIAILLALFINTSPIISAFPFLSTTASNQSTHAVLGLVAGFGWLIWQPDKGFRFKNGLLVILQLILVIGVSLSVLRYTPPFVFDASGLLNQTNVEFLRLDNTNAMIIAFAFIAGIKAFIRPSYFNVSLFSTMVTLPIVLSTSHFQHTFLVTGLIALVALLLIASILIESRHMAFRDQLTQIPSRTALQQYIQTLGSRYAVVMADIDHFKKFNDTHGHDIGDQVLKLVAKKINEVGGGGKTFRYGGEEFIIVFTDKQAHQIIPFVEQVRSNIEHYPLVLRSKDRPSKKPPQKNKKIRKPQNKQVYVTSSFGVAELKNKTEDFEYVMKQADNALYKAKKAGRNCVKTA